jgi:hypothetical protein
MADFLRSKYTEALENQSENLTCPYCSGGIFQNEDQLWDHDLWSTFRFYRA